MFAYIGRYNGPRPSKVDQTFIRRCPACHHLGACTAINGTVDLAWEINSNDRHEFADHGHYYAGYRRCPNDKCGCLLFFVFAPEGSYTFPPEVIDFDASNLPPSILQSLEEAVGCHSARCFRAAALMVRRTLEELC